MNLTPISPAQLYEHVCTRVADDFLSTEGICRHYVSPLSGNCLDGNPVLIVRRDGQIYITHEAGCYAGMEGEL